jgi:uncharacterized membrane protein YphA (DoxX/SURF4 family)
MNRFLTRIQPLAPIIIRLGMGVVFLFFSYYQFSDASAWTGYVPHAVVALFGGNATMLVLLNAWFELIAGLSLLAGFQTRIVSLLLALHLFGITATIGISPLGVRDLGLAVATLSIAFAGPDTISIDKKFAKKANIEMTDEPPFTQTDQLPIRSDQARPSLPRRI